MGCIGSAKSDPTPVLSPQRLEVSERVLTVKPTDVTRVHGRLRRQVTVVLEPIPRAMALRPLFGQPW